MAERQPKCLCGMTAGDEWEADRRGWRKRASPRSDGQQIEFRVYGRAVASTDEPRWWCGACVVTADRCVFPGRQS